VPSSTPHDADGSHNAPAVAGRKGCCDMPNRRPAHVVRDRSAISSKAAGRMPRTGYMESMTSVVSAEGFEIPSDQDRHQATAKRSTAAWSPPENRAAGCRFSHVEI
jgi:hypothetical protein